MTVFPFFEDTKIQNHFVALKWNNVKCPQEQKNG